MQTHAVRLLVSSILISLASTWAKAQSDSPDLDHWSGSAYHGNWYAYTLKEPYSDGSAKLDNSTAFILSPRYSAPIRKLIVRLKCNQSAPTRRFTAAAMVNGVETDDETLVRTASSVSQSNEFEYFHFDWSSSDNVTALRLFLAGSGSANWGIAEIHVFYGEKTAEEDDFVRELVKVLPSPGNLAAESFTSSSLTLVADEVEYASGYRFVISRLQGIALATVREDFAAAPSLGGSEWTLETGNASLSQYTSSTYCDTKFSSDQSSLRIDVAGKTESNVRVGFVSPVVPDAINELQFMCKVNTAGKSDRFSIFARTGENAQWTEIETVIPESSSKIFVTNIFDRASNYRQAKVEFSAESDNFSVAAIDSLWLSYGGNEESDEIISTETLDEPRYSAQNLAEGRYSAKVAAIAADGANYASSSWSEPIAVDLSWANITVSSPQNVAGKTKNGKLEISWDKVANAEYYLIDVKTSGYPQEEVISNLKCLDSPVSVEVPSLGEYEIKVTAVSPGGCSLAAGDSASATLELGGMGAIDCEAADSKSVRLSWKAVPFAEGYRVETYEIAGSILSDTTDYGSLPDVWPAGWTHHEFIDKSYATPAPKIEWQNTWIASPAYDEPVTRIEYSFKSHASQEITSMSAVRVDTSTSESGDDWQLGLRQDFAATTNRRFSAEIPYANRVRRVRFVFLIEPDDIRYRPLIEFGKVTVVCGRETAVKIGSTTVTGPLAAIGELKSDARYIFEVSPLPSEGNALGAKTPVIDMSLMQPRETAALRFGAFKSRAYEEDFSALATATRETPLRELKLPYWQFRKGDDEPGTIKYSKTGKATAGGVYVLSDESASESSFMLGTLATSDCGCTFGIAFTNDLGCAVENPKIAFDTVQRSFKDAAKGYVFEYLTTGGDIAIDADGEWKSAEIPISAPLTTETRGERSEYRQSVPAFALEAKIPAGGVLAIRWRDPKRSASPMMGIDNFRIEHDAVESGMVITVR